MSSLLSTPPRRALPAPSGAGRPRRARVAPVVSLPPRGCRGADATRPPRATRGAGAALRDRRQSGVALMLAVFVLTVLLVVAFELRFAAEVESDFVRLTVQSATMHRIADAARQQALSTLLMDVESSDPEGGGGLGGDGGDGGDGATAGDGATGGTNPLGGADGSPEAGGPGGVTDVVGQSDSRLDEWNDSTAMAPAMGDGLTLYIEVVDEDSKINLLGLWTEDEERREEVREIVHHLLDIAFEGTSRDLSFSDARDVLDALDDWVRGTRGSYNDRIPLPPLKRSQEEQEAASEGEFEVIDTGRSNDERNFPLTLGELLLVEGIEPDHLEGFVENDEFHPGLSQYLTIWSNLELLPPPEDDEFQWGLLPGTEAQEQSEEEDAREEITAQATYDGLVNINTAPLVVLRAIARQKVPLSALELIEDFRDKIDELGDEFDTSKFFEDDEVADDQLGGFGLPDDEQDPELEEEEEEITKYVFVDPTEVFRKVEEEFHVTVNADDIVKEEFLSWFGVRSQVFTLKILVREPPSDVFAGREQMGEHRWYRTVVWRTFTSDRPRIMTLLPLEAYHDPRRLIDLPEDLGDVSEDRFLDAGFGR